MMKDDESRSYRTLLKITNAIINQRSSQGIFREITSVLQPLLRFDRISILLLGSSGQSNWEYFSPPIGVALPGLKNNKLPPKKALIPIMAMTKMKTIITDVQHEPLLPEYEMLRKANLNWFICTPLLIKDRVLGTIQLFYRDAFPLKDDEINLFENVSQQIALVIDNMLAYVELERLRDRLAEEKSYLKKKIETLEPPQDIIYMTHVMQRLMDMVTNVATTDTTVLIAGETGTGKDLVARSIHRLSERRNNTFIMVNCAALVPTLIESELFGHEKGAFTDAGSRKIGRFEIANGSTLFLDEISELPLNTQAKLLQVIQEGSFERVGGSETIKTDVRIIAATNQDLIKMVADKKFREDLFYRLNIFPIYVPPLRERKEDIPVLGRYFGNKFCEKLNRPRPVLTSEAIAMLIDYAWPGNVRELQNFMERLIILKSGKTVAGEDIKSILTTDGEPESDLVKLEDIERHHIKKILRKTKGIVAGPRGAGKLLGLKRGTLLYRLKKLGIDPSDFRQWN